MKAVIDADTCIGCGLCPDLCPEVFQMTEAGDKAEVIADPVPGGKEDDARSAASSCPVDAITIQE